MAKLTLTIEIPSSKLARTKQRQLANRPNDREIPDPNNPGKLIPEFTFKQWIEYQVKEVLRKWDKNGERIFR